jgi:hypothetical protein
VGDLPLNLPGVRGADESKTLEEAELFFMGYFWATLCHDSEWSRVRSTHHVQGVWKNEGH